MPHRPYYKCLKDLFGKRGLVGLAHITGGGMKENINRILPEGLSAKIDLEKIKILPIFSLLKKYGELEDADMLRTFNMGVGLAAVVREDFSEKAIAHVQKFGIDAYEIGTIEKGSAEKVVFEGELTWS